MPGLEIDRRADIKKNFTFPLDAWVVCMILSCSSQLSVDTGVVFPEGRIGMTTELGNLDVAARSLRLSYG